MIKYLRIVVLAAALFTRFFGSAQDSIALKDINWDKNYPAGSTELFIPSGNQLLAGFIYRANGEQKHPTLLLLHGYPGNERNLDLAQIVRAKGWNVIYFDYRGSWGSQGKFSFKNCVDDVKNVVAFCNKYQDSLKIDTSNIVLFGHSMGGWICVKALSEIPQIKKGFALSTWDIYNDMKNVKDEKELSAIEQSPAAASMKYFVLNATFKEIFEPVIKDEAYFNLANVAAALKNKSIIMLDEHSHNNILADTFKQVNKTHFEYEVWPTDHGFTNKRISLINKVIAFIGAN
ncbi:MAG: alpha/beta fold hydrolase [Chitinophagaceae bacterium]